MRIKTLLYSLIYLFYSQISLAQTAGDYRTAQASVSWSNAAHWQTWDGTQWTTASNPPGSGNDIYVQAGHTATLNANQSCNALFISTGTSSATAGGDGQVVLQANTLNVNGKLSCYFGTVNTTNGSGSALSITTSSTTPSLPISKTSGGILKFVGASRNITNTNEWGAGATGSTSLFDVEFALNSGETGTIVSILKAANWKFSSGTINAQVRIAVDNGSSGQGDLVIASGAVLISGESGSGTTPVISRTTSTVCGTVNIQGTLKLNGASPHIQCSSYVLGANSLVEYSRAGNQNFLASSFSGSVDLLNYTNVALSGSGTKTTLASMTTDIVANGSLTMMGSALALGTSGTFSVSSSGTTLTYAGTSAQSASTTEWNPNFQNLNINNSAGVSLGFSRTLSGILTLSNGTFTNNSNLTLGSNASIIRINGSLSNVPIFGSSINVKYEQGNATINTGNELPSNDSILQDLTINNSNGITLSSAVTVNGDLIFMNGIINNNSSTLLTLGSVATVGSGSASAYVNGPIKKFGNSAFVLPIGKGSRWARVGISNHSGSSSDFFTAEYFNSPPSNQNSLGSGLSGGRISNKEYWEISPNTTLSAKLTLHWEDGGFSGITSPASSDLVVAHYTGSSWQSDSSSLSTGSGSAGSVTSKTINSWGAFTFGSPNNKNALPVKLIFFRTKFTETAEICLEWATANENSCAGFEIQRSDNGFDFNNIGFVNSKSEGGNSSEIINYNYCNYAPLGKTCFYRLKQTDNNGRFEYSPIIKHSLSIEKTRYWILSGKTIVLPFLSQPSNLITIYDLKGQILERISCNAYDLIDLSKRTDGIYLLQINDDKPVKFFLRE